MNDLQQFTNQQFGDIRALSIEGEPWFVGKDIAERTINNPDGSVRITRTTKVTGKGQTYFINRFLAKGD